MLTLASFPTRAYLQQNHQRAQLSAHAAALAAQNSQLNAQAAQLQTDDAVEQLARDRYQLVMPGEEAYSILPTSPPPSTPTAAAPATAPKPVAHPNWVSRAWARVTSIF